jgi:hypothetical protein
VGVDGVAHVTVGLVRRRGIELADEADRGLSGLADEAAQGEYARQPDGPWQLLPSRPGLTCALWPIGILPSGSCGFAIGCRAC